MIRELVAAYRQEGHGLFYAGLERGMRSGKLAGMMVRAATLVQEGSLSPVTFVGYICRTFQVRRRRFPYPGEVFGTKAVTGWFAEYQRNAARLLPMPAYRARRA